MLLTKSHQKILFDVSYALVRQRLKSIEVHLRMAQCASAVYPSTRHPASIWALRHPWRADHGTRTLRVEHLCCFQVCGVMLVKAKGLSVSIFCKFSKKQSITQTNIRYKAHIQAENIQS